MPTGKAKWQQIDRVQPLQHGIMCWNAYNHQVGSLLWAFADLSQAHTHNFDHKHMHERWPTSRPIVDIDNVNWQQFYRVQGFRHQKKKTGCLG